MFCAGPNTSGSIRDNNTTIPNTSGTATTYDMILAARVNIETPKEPYAGNFSITALGNPAAYTVNYISTTGSPTNMPYTPDNGYMSGRTIQIENDVPTRDDGYEFLGWCTVSTSDNSCNGQVVQPNTTYTFADINYKANNVLNLYAIWEKHSCDGYKIMQDVIDWEDELTTTGATIEACDIRDYKTYFVSRLADGNIWMTQNLDFEITSEPLTSETSDLTAYNTGGYTSAAGYTQVNGITKWTPAETAITTNSVTPVSTSTGTVVGLTGWTNDNAAPYSSEGGDVYVYTSANTNADTIYTSLADCVAASHTETECKHYHRGNYYNWNAAVASNNTNVAELGTNYTTAQNSICPAGWKLPVGAKASSYSQSNTEFAYLLKQTGIFTSYPSSITNSASYATNGFNNIRSNPLFFVRSGYVYSASLYNSGTGGDCWSSSVGSSTNAYYLGFSSSGVSPELNGSRNSGFSVRCVARKPYMQDVAKWEDKIPNIGDEITVADKRDGKEYTVARQIDGNIWMTQNLDFEITSADLTSDTSDLTAYNTNGYTSDAGYSKSGDIIKWTPASTAITSGRTAPVSTSTGTISSSTAGWANNDYAPYSAEGSDVYVYTSGSTSADTIYTSLSSCTKASHTEAECKHYHRGNYYNWSAAVASNNTNVTELTTQFNTAQNSICPAGWRLPVGAKANSFSQNNTEFVYLLKQSNVFTSYPSYLNNSTSYTTNGFNNIRSNPLFFVRSGDVDSTSLEYSGTLGLYWSSSVHGTARAYGLYFGSGGIIPASTDVRYNGENVRCVARLYYMQDITKWENEIPNTGDSLQVIDKRDHKTYWVTRQTDGNIWMTQNLDFEITSEPLTSETSDLTVYDTGGYTSSAGYSKIGNTIKWTPASTAITSGRTVPISTSTGNISGLTNWANDYYAPYSAEGGDVYVYTSNSTSTDTIYTSLSSCIAASHTEAECKHYHRGNYYNWSAAVASNNTNVTELKTQYNTAQNSICPAGWRLPVGAKADLFSQTNTEFAYLLKQSNIFANYPSSITGYSNYIANGFNNIRSSSLFFVRSGYVYSVSFNSSGRDGLYWSSSVYNNANAHRLNFSGSDVYPANYNYRYYGQSVRCVARTYYMQDVANWENEIPNTGDSLQVIDKRDHKTYWVTRLADGKIWMLDNLDFNDTTVTLTSENTDISTSSTFTKLPNAHGTWTSSTQNSYVAAYINAGYSTTVPTDTTSTNGDYKTGTYYNYCAASAGTICSSSNSANAEQSICPAGWRLPTSDEFNTLYTTSSYNYNTYDKYRAALHLPLSRRFFSGSQDGATGYGYFWTSSYGTSATTMKQMYITTTSVTQANAVNRRYGNSVRCVAR